MANENAAQTLQEELTYFQGNLERLMVAHKGKYALIKGSELIGTFDTEENAYEAGIARFGNTPFLIREVTDTEPTARFPALTVGLLRANP